MSWEDNDDIKRRFRFLCGARWDEMAPTDAPNARTCGHCDRQVFHARSEAEMNRYARAGHCVAVTPAAGPPLISMPEEGPRWDARVEVPGDQARLCAGPVIPIGAEAGVTGLTLEELAPRHAELRVGPEGATLVPRAGAACRIADAPDGWTDVAPIDGPAAVAPGAWMHFGPPEAGASARLIEIRPTGPGPRPEIHPRPLASAPMPPPVRVPVPGMVSMPRPLPVPGTVVALPDPPLAGIRYRPPGERAGPPVLAGKPYVPPERPKRRWKVAAIAVAIVAAAGVAALLR